MTTPAAKFSTMSAEMFAALKAGDEVVNKAGVTHRVMPHTTEGKTWIQQVRAGKLYGRTIEMKRENIAAPVAANQVPAAAPLSGDWWLPMSARRF